VAGYSGAPLAQKLGIGARSQVCVVGAPKGYAQLFEPALEAAQLTARVDRNTDVVHIFSTRRGELDARVKDALARMRDDCSVWVSWPKKAARVATDITEDTVRDIALPLGLVDVKVCAIDAVWSGLKLVVRRERRTGAKR